MNDHELKCLARAINARGGNLTTLVQLLDDRTLKHLVAASYHEDVRRFDERCAAHPANARTP